MTAQLNLFPPIYPSGFSLRENFISPAEELLLLSFAQELSWENYTMMGVAAKRKIYRFDVERPLSSELLFLLPRVAKELGVPESHIIHVLFTYYPVGAPIGWHRDAPNFESLLGISLASFCEMKMRPYDRSSSPTLSIPLDPLSAYVIKDEARWNWEHHIPPVEATRYSLTFRTQRG